MRFNHKVYLPAFSFILFSAFSFSCSHNKKQQDTSNPNTISDSLIRVAKPIEAKMSYVQNQLKLVGKIDFNENKVVKVYPFAGGVVQSIHVELGDFVNKGDLLATVKSSEMADIDNQLQSAQSDLAIAQKNYDVAQQLYQSGLSSDKDVTIAKNELDRSKSSVLKNTEVLSLYRKGKTASEYDIVAPLSGYVVEKNITKDMQFRADGTSPMLVISDLSEVWVIAYVYETDINKVKENDTVRVTTLAYPDKPIAGVINKVFNVLDPDTRAMQIRINLLNANLALKPEMFANVDIFYHEKEKMVMIPSSAVVFDNSNDYVLIYKSEQFIEIQKVKTYLSINGMTYVSNGLKEGEKVISNNSLLLYNALNKD